MIDITSQTTELLQAALTVIGVVFVVMVVSNKLAHMIRKRMIED